MESQKNIHIGSLIKEKMEERGLTVTDFARLLHYERTNIYKIFKRSSIDVDLLMRISRILSYDFLREIYMNDSSDLSSSSSSSSPTYTLNVRIDREAAEILRELIRTFKQRD